MSSPFRTFRAFLFLLIAMMIGSGVAVAAPQGGHGGGAGHALGGFRGGGVYHGGYRGPYGYGHPYYGYPIGFGFGLGFGYGYGYPYPAYGYPVYVDPAYGPPLDVYPQLAPPPVLVPKTGGVTLNVKAPSDAVIWVNGEKTTQTGPNREFMTSGLLPGRTYTFDIRAEWRGPDGKTVSLEQRIPVQAGDRRMIDFEMRTRSPEVVVPVRAGSQ